MIERHGSIGTAGKSASSPGHLEAAKTKPNAAAATTTSSDASTNVASTSPSRGQHAK